MAIDRFILGENLIYSMDCNETGLNNNVIVCGGSGSGKTMSISEPRLLETFNTSIIATVTKRKIVNKYKSVFKERGYVVHDLNFINPAESNIAYDPLAYIKGYSDITFLAQSIVKADPRKEKSNADPYWDQASISLLSALIASTLMTKENATFADVLQMLDNMEMSDAGNHIDTSLDRMFNKIEKKDSNCFAISCWRSFKQLPSKTASCVFGTLNTAIDTIFSPELRRMIALNEKIDIERLASEKTILFISTSAVNPALHRFVNMFYSQAFKQLFEFAESCPDGKLPVPVHVLCDDFATGSRILNFPEYISVFREKGVSVTLLIQSESQLQSIYGSDEATTIINNCDTYLYMGGMDLKTGRSVSERLNIPLDEVLYMPLGQVFVFRRGQRPIVAQRYNILEDDLYLKITKKYEMSIAGNER